MERRYFVAALALIATFAVFSRGLRALQQYSQLPGPRVEVRIGMTCPTSSSKVSRWIAKARTHLRPALPEEAQLLAEMNLPIAAMQARVEEQAARQGEAAARCAREIAMREAERGQREAERAQREAERAQRQAIQIQEKMANLNVHGPMDPMSIEVNMPDDLEQRIQLQTSALANRMTATSVKLQVAADRLKGASLRMAGVQNINFDVHAPQVAAHVSTHAPCKVRGGQAQIRRGSRDSRGNSLRPGEYAY